MLLEGNANDIVQTMRRDDTGADITDAVVSCKMYDALGTLCDTVTLSYQGEGEYRGTTSFIVAVGVQYLFDIKSSNYLFRRIITEKALSPLNIS